MEKKNPHQKTINALIRKLGKLEEKAKGLDDEIDKVARAIEALGGTTGEVVATASVI